MTVSEFVRDAARDLDRLAEWPSLGRLDTAVDVCVEALAARKPMLVCGNGGSASDATHIAAELVGRFQVARRPLNCIALGCDPAITTAWTNDYGFETLFSRQVEAYGMPGGVVFGISTSGNSPNVVRALEAGRKLGMTTIGLTGQGGGKLAAWCDILIDVPGRPAAPVQQLHAVLYHYLCGEIEARLVARWAAEAG